jgi:hypothetical protein
MIKFTKKEIQDMQEFPDVLRALAYLHDVQSGMIGPSTTRAKQAEHIRRSRELLGAAAQIEQQEEL